MLPLSDGLSARRFPIVNIALIVANFAVWLFYELPHLDSAVYHASFYPCAVDNACRAPEAWGARVPSLSASGAIAAVLGAYFVLYPGSRVSTWIFPIFIVKTAVLTGGGQIEITG